MAPMDDNFPMQALLIAFLAYFLVQGLACVLLQSLSLANIKRFLENRPVTERLKTAMDYYPPVSVIFPFSQIDLAVHDQINALTRLAYPEAEMILVYDGNYGRDFDALVTELDLVAFPEPYRQRLMTAPVETIYNARNDNRLRLIRKAPGSMADSLNAGLNLARYPLVAPVTLDAVLAPDALEHLAMPFLEDRATVASSGIDRVAGETREQPDGTRRLSRNGLVLLQVIERLRVGFFTQLGSVGFNGNLDVSEALTIFDKERVVAVGGYAENHLNPNQELVLRLQRTLRESGERFRVSLVPERVSARTAPGDFKTLGLAHSRRHEGLIQSLSHNSELMANPNGGMLSWFSIPYTLLFEVFAPLIELAALAFFVIAAVGGYIPVSLLIVFLVMSVGIGLMVTLVALLLDEIATRSYRKPGEIFGLFAMTICYYLFYRPVAQVYELSGLLRGLLNAARAELTESPA